MNIGDFKRDDIPYPQQWWRKHDLGDLGGRDYATLSVFHVAERQTPDGRSLPKMLRCVMFGTFGPQEELKAPDAATGQMMLDAHFSKRFPDHHCNRGCLGWRKTGDDNPSSNPEPISHTLQ